MQCELLIDVYRGRFSQDTAESLDHDNRTTSEFLSPLFINADGVFYIAGSAAVRSQRVYVGSGSASGAHE